MLRQQDEDDWADLYLAATDGNITKVEACLNKHRKCGNLDKIINKSNHYGYTPLILVTTQRVRQGLAGKFSYL
jgi:hypothetical protein